MRFCRCSGKRSLGCCKSLFSFPVSSQMNWVDTVFMDLRVFLLVPLSIEVVLPEWTCCRVCLIFSSTIGTLERVQTWFTFLGFKAWWISLFIGLAALAEFAMILWFVGSIILNALWTLDSTRKSQMTPFPAVFTLWDFRVHISCPNSCNKSSDVEAPIDKSFGFYTALSIPDINLYNCHIQFGRCFNHSWLGCKSDVVKNLVLLDNSFDITWGEVIL